MTPGKLTEPVMNHDDWELHSRDVCYQGFFRMEKLRLRHRTYAGEWTPVFERELFERGEAVCVLLYDPQRDCLVLTEQFRVGAVEDERSPWLIELVAGMIEEGETAADVASRETLEEAGCRFYDLIPLHRYWASPGGCSERIHLYCGLLDSDGVGGIHGLQHEQEDIRLIVTSFEEAWTALQQGVINNAATIIALQWLFIHRDELRQRSLPQRACEDG